MSSEIKVLSPGRYVGTLLCKEKNGIYYSTPDRKCEDPKHYDQDQKHFSIIINYHVPHVGVVGICAHSEKEADLKSKTVIYEEMTKAHIKLTKRCLELEKLIKEIT